MVKQKLIVEISDAATHKLFKQHETYVVVHVNTLLVGTTLACYLQGKISTLCKF